MILDSLNQKIRTDFLFKRRFVKIRKKSSRILLFKVIALK